MLIDRHLAEIMQIPGLIGREELDYLCQMATEVSSWTEIGTYCGRSFYAVGLHLPKDSFLQVIDNNLGTILRANQTLLTTYTQLVHVRPDLRISMHRMRSWDCENVADTEAVFIDGNHTYEHVKRDIEIWSKKSRLLLGHDYGYPGYPGVQQAVDEAVHLIGFQQIKTVWKLEVAR